MPVSGIINGSTNNQYIESKIEWQGEPNIPGNSSEVSAFLYYRRTNTGFVTEGTGSFSIVINGTLKTVKDKHLKISNEWVLAMSANVSVSHNSDGKKSITIKATGSLPPSSLQNTYCSGIVDLDIIPRQSNFASITSTMIIDGTNRLSFNITRYSAEHKHTVTISMNEKSIILTDIDTSGSAVIPIDWLFEIPNTPRGTITVTLDTFNKSTQVGKRVTKYVSVYPPESAKPDILSFTLEKAAGCKEPIVWNNYVQGCTKLELSLSVGMDNTYGSKIASISISGDGVSHEASGETYTSVISDYISGSGVVTYKAVVKDTRGRTNELDIAINVDSYAPPTPERCTASRCLADGTLSESGNYISISSNLNYSACSGQNKAIVKAYWRKSGASSWSPDDGILMQNNVAKVIEQEISLYDTYEVLLTASDLINPNPSAASQKILSIRTTLITFMLRRGGKGASFGTEADEDNCLNVKEWKGRFKNIEINGSEIKDFITESGNFGIWTYRKWASGIAECWGAAKFTCNLQSSEPLYYASGSVSLPFAFEADPLPVASGSCPWNYLNWVNAFVDLSDLSKCRWLYYQTNNNGTGSERIVYLHAIGNIREGGI